METGSEETNIRYQPNSTGLIKKRIARLENKAAVLRIERGKISIDEPVEQYVIYSRQNIFGWISAYGSPEVMQQAEQPVRTTGVRTAVVLRVKAAS